MNQIVTWLTNIGATLLPILQQQVLYSSVIFVVVLLLSLALKKRASLLHLGLWSLVVFRLVLPTNLSFDFSARAIFDRLRPEPVGERQLASMPAKPDNLTALPTHETPSLPSSLELENKPFEHAMDDAPVFQNAQRMRQIPWAAFLTGLWLTGFLCLLLLYVKRLLDYGRIRREARYIVTSRITGIVEKWRSHFRIKRQIDVLGSESARSPFTLGLLHPVIILPQKMLADFTTAKLEAVIAHECAHIKNFDDLWIKLQNLLQILYFFHPLLWITNNRIHLYRECLCDEMVLGANSVSIRDYGQGLLDTLRSNFLSVAHADFIAGFGSPKNKLVFRIRNMKKCQKSSWLSRIAIFVFVVFLGLVALPMAECTQENNHAEHAGNETDLINELYAKMDHQIGTPEPTSFVEPLAAGTYTVTSKFGYNTSSKTSIKSFHSGVNLAVPIAKQAQVFAIADGIIVKTVVTFDKTTEIGERGKQVFIAHSDSLLSRYCYLDTIFVHEGNAIKQGDVIGLVSGAVKLAGSHLHFEILKSGIKVDPLDYFTFSVPQVELIGGLLKSDGERRHVFSPFDAFVTSIRWDEKSGGTRIYLRPKQGSTLILSADTTDLVLHIKTGDSVKTGQELLTSPGGRGFGLHFMDRMDFIRPLEIGRLTDKFGQRAHPTAGETQFHDGLDIAAPRGTPVYAAASGKIVQVIKMYKPDFVWGRVIIIEHENKYKTRYCHLKEIKVLEGQEVKQGEIIGTSGDTGRSPGPHLHFEVWEENVPVNPEYYFATVNDSGDLTNADTERLLKITREAIKTANQNYKANINFIRPVDKNKSAVSDSFGLRKHPTIGVQQFHEGVDFRAPSGTDVYASAAGTVQHVIENYRPNESYGRQIVIKHASGYITRYTHLDTIFVKEGDIVEQGHVIGTVGSTGRSAEPHLHFEVIHNEQVENPAHYMEIEQPENNSSATKLFELVDFIRPVDKNNSTVTYGFGVRTHPKIGIQQFHEGVDFRAPIGMEVYASAAGTIQLVIDNYKANEGYGKQIVIEHASGYKTRYAHLDTIFVKVGDVVEQGQAIGAVGSTGRSEGPHLHFELIHNGKNENPANYMEIEKPESENTKSRLSEERVDFIRLVAADKSTVPDSSDTFGFWTHPTIGTKQFHRGVDFSAPLGTDVLASADGTVVQIQESYRPNESYGRQIFIEHASGYKTFYAHLQKILVKEGDVVKQGDIIGAVGSTGRSEGPHLHFEIIHNDQAENPALFIQDGDLAKFLKP